MKNIVSSHLFALCLLSLPACGQNIKTTLPEKANIEAQTTVQVSEVRKDVFDKIPHPKGLINDFAQVLTKSQINVLDSMVRAYESKSTNEIAIVILDSAMTTKEELWEFCNIMIQKWAIGKWNKNNGIIITIAPAINKIQINTESDFDLLLSEEALKSIINKTIAPYVRQGNYYKGAKEGIVALIKQITENGD